MRECAECKKPDRAQRDIWAECNCGSLSPNPEDHSPDCWSVMHEVVLYPIRISRRELSFEMELSSYYQQRGWMLKENGKKYYRVKMLCRECIQLEVSATERRKDYEKACRAVRGHNDQTYAQMLARQ